MDGFSRKNWTKLKPWTTYNKVGLKYIKSFGKFHIIGGIVRGHVLGHRGKGYFYVTDFRCFSWNHWNWDSIWTSMDFFVFFLQ